MTLRLRWSLGFLGAACLFGAAGCGGEAKANVGFAPKTAANAARKNPDGSQNDQSRCEWQGKGDREASETAGPGFLQPNVRRVWQVVGTGDDRRKVLVCREIDTNFDGVKDVVRKYNDKGESLYEESDADHDGKVDTWLTFSKGHLAEEKIDHNHDGKPDEWKVYTGGQLSRIKRDTNFDGKPDVWEIYRQGALERMGVDVNGDEQVDRWDHDNELRRRFEEAERKKEEEAAALSAKKAAEAKAAEEASEGEGDGSKPGGPASKPASKRKKK